MEHNIFEGTQVGHKISEVWFYTCAMPKFTGSGTVIQFVGDMASGIQGMSDQVMIEDDNGVEWCFWMKTIKSFRNDTIESKYEMVETMLADLEMF